MAKRRCPDNRGQGGELVANVQLTPPETTDIEDSRHRTPGIVVEALERDEPPSGSISSKATDTTDKIER